MSDVQVDQSHILLPEYRGRLLEGITYNKSNNSLLWIDIILAEVHRYFFDTQVHQVLKLTIEGDSIGTIGLTKDDDKIVVCNKTGVSIGDFNTNEIKQIFAYPPNERLRSNDGKIDPHGNLIVGTMDDFQYDKVPEGSVYIINSKTLEQEVWKTNTIIANGLGFNSDLTKFYWTDSPTNKIYQYDYDFALGKIQNEKVFFDSSVFSGSKDIVPDGMCTTDKDTIFTALFNGSCVVNLDKDGNTLRKFNMTAQRLTCCTVGGLNDDELFITSAHAEHEDLDAVIVPDKKGDLGGYLYRVKLDAPCKEIQYIWGGDI